jgi:biofilm PGA synthesis N-glycosyltransferase PgaC
MDRFSTFSEAVISNTSFVLNGAIDNALSFLIAYPFVTCMLWSLSSIYYMLMRKKQTAAQPAGTLPAYSVMIPFHAEPDGALRTMRSLARVTPQPREIIIIDDGSPITIALDAALPGNVRVVRLPRNLGKGGALQTALKDVTTEVVVCMDADTETESVDWSKTLAAFADPALGAVTGKIRPVDGGGLVECFQALDYLSIIAVIKAAESAWGGLLTVSGAFTAFRTSALRSIGGWNPASSTEDIDASWRLQSIGWRLAFEKDWTARVEMAPTIPTLWRQRRRWSAGLGRALRDHGATSLFAGARHLPIVVLTLTSLGWMVSMLVFLANALLFDGVQSWQPGTLGAVIVISLAAFYAQLSVAIAVDGRGISAHMRSIALAPFYPLYFWGILMTSFIAGFPNGVSHKDTGTWSRTQRRAEIEVVT